MDCFTTSDEEGKKTASKFFDQAKKRDRRLASLDPSDYAELASVVGIDDVIKGGIFSQLLYFDQKLKLGLKLKLSNLGNHFSGKGIENERRNQAENLVSSYFNDGTSDYAPMVTIRGLSTFDTVFKDLKKYGCQNGGNEARMRDQVIRGYAFCGDGYDGDKKFGYTIEAARARACTDVMALWK
jgi:hypothetical protein